MFIHPFELQLPGHPTRRLGRFGPRYVDALDSLHFIEQHTTSEPWVLQYEGQGEGPPWGQGAV